MQQHRNGNTYWNSIDIRRSTAVLVEGMAFRLNLIGRFALANTTLIRRYNMYTSAAEHAGSFCPELLVM